MNTEVINMGDKRSAILSLLKILFTYSDTNTHLTRKEINEHLAKDGIEINRKTFGEYIKTINEMFDDCIAFDEKNFKTRTYFFTHTIEPAHIQLLLDTLYSSHYIDDSQRQKIRDALLKSTSSIVRDDYCNIFTENNQNARNDKQLLYVYSEIMDAIKGNKQISFDYHGYDINKELQVVRPGVIVSPYHIIHRDGHPYLNCYNHAYQGMRTYRADYINNIKILDIKRKPQEEDKPNNNAFINDTYMFDGDVYKVKLKIQKKAFNYFVDEFYNSLKVVDHDDTTYTFTINSTLTGLKYMLYQFIEHIEDICLEQNLSDSTKEVEKDLLLKEIIEHLEKALTTLKTNKNSQQDDQEAHN